MIFPRQGRSILHQTFWLLVGSLIVVQAINTTSLFFLSPPRQEGVPMVQIVDRLRGMDVRHHRRPPVFLPISRLPAAPPVEPELVSKAELTEEFAARLGLPVDQVRLYFHPSKGLFFTLFRDGPDDGVPRWRGEPIFFDRTVAAAQINGQWRMVRTPDRPLIAEWQKRIVLLFAISMLALTPLAWLFARRLVLPIRAFANAADRVGHDASAPMVREDGPAELRVAARAVNAMQGRITEQLSEREAMVAAIAHDLRTPLSRIAFRIETADDALREPIQRDIDQMKAMITATLSFVRGSAPDARQGPVDLVGLVEAIVTDEQHVGRPVSIAASAPETAVTVRGDRVALGRMIQNLVDNAIAYGERADVSLQAQGGQARIRIADRGPGLPADQIEAMFAPFARQERSRNRETGGVGLGLAIARAIARDHGGEVTLGPRDGGGLEAEISLPLAGVTA